MKKYFYIVLIAPMFALAQVGINTTTPAAQLDIKSSNQATPANTDGILIPKIDAFPAVNPTAAQKGMLVYLTTTSGANQPGFYFWNDPGWVRIVTGSAGGTLDQSYDFGGAGAGKTITADTGAVTIAGTDGLVSTGTSGSGAVAPSGAGTRMVWNPNKSAFRVGTVSGVVSGLNWDNVNIGQGSVAMGTNTRANGSDTFAMGNNALAQGTAATAFGNGTSAIGNNSFAVGNTTLANNTASTAMGTLTTASGTNSFAMGLSSTASGPSSVAMGNNTLASGGTATALGGSTVASGSLSTAMGFSTTAAGENAIAAGTSNTASSFGESVLGIGATTYTPSVNGATQFRAANVTDRLLVVGNAIDANNNSTVDVGERSDALVILKNGNTGIGSSTPQDKLHVVGNIRMVDGNQGSGKVLTSDANGTATWQTPAAMAETDPQVSSTTTGRVPRWNGSTLSDGVLFDDATNIGIGTATPADKLHVVGNIRMVDGNQGAGKVLTSDINGTATWQTPAAGNSWSLVGNAGTSAGTNFIGTTDNQDVVFKRFNTTAGRLGTFNTSFGNSSMNLNSSGTRNTAFGVLSLFSNSTGSNNVAIGYNALFNSTSSENTAVGANSLQTNNTGISNAAVGFNALKANSSGNSNVAVGHSAMENNNTGNFNSALGFSALNANTIGINNVAVGTNSLFSNNASENTASGVNSLRNNTTGTGNAAFGYNAAQSNNGNFNVSVGHSSLFSNSSGNRNTALGTLSLFSSIGNDNVAVGYNALTDNASSEITAVGSNSLENNTSGIFNAAVGFNSLKANTSGSNNTATGHSSLLNNTTGNMNSALGFSALSSNTNGSNNVAIGGNALPASNASDNTAVGVNAMQTNTSGLGNAALGTNALFQNQTGQGNSSVGYFSLNSNTSGSLNTGLGYLANVANSGLTNATAIGANALAGASNSLVLGSINGVNSAFSDTNVGIGTTTPLDRLHVVGNIRMVDGNQAAGRVLTSDANGRATWQNASANAWGLTGNAGTNPATNFIGTTDNQDLVFRRNNAISGRIGAANTSFGSNALPILGGLNNTAFGVNALSIAAGSSNRNVAVGVNALQNSNANDNTALGFGALAANTTGARNTATGSNALSTAQLANDNTANGFNALRNNTSGISNTAVGSGALAANAVGAQNTAVGANALAVSTASDNTAIGHNALSSNTTGTFNTALGKDALALNVSGSSCTAVGYGALDSNTTGTQNIAIGSLALGANTTGSSNTATGRGALSANTTGNGNTANGFNALFSNTTGLSNTAVGGNSLFSNTIGTSNIAIGDSALSSNIDGNLNAGLGTNALFSNTTGSNNSASGVAALLTNTTGSRNSAFGTNADVGFNNLTNATAIGANALVSTSNSLVLGSVNGVNSATATVNVGIGTTTPADRLHVVGNIRMVDGNQGSGKVLTSDANGTATWQNASANAWGLTGNAGANPTTNFIGTTDNFSLALRTNGIERLRACKDGTIVMGETKTAQVVLPEFTANPYRTFITSSGAKNIQSSFQCSNTPAEAATYEFTRYRGTLDTHNVVASGDVLGRIDFKGGHLTSSSYTPGASAATIESQVDGAVAVSKVPGRLDFLTTEEATSNPQLRMTIRSSGNVGINVAAPAERLHVVGNIRMVDGNQGAGKVLTSDINGTATWQNPATISGVTLDEAYDQGGAGAGRTIIADTGAVTIAGTDGLVSTGTLGSGVLAPTGAGTRMVWNPNKGAFRAGTVSGTQWDDANIGVSSIALGLNSIASGISATAFGRNNTASGTTSMVWGEGSSATNLMSTAWGNASVASGQWATSFGRGVTASGDYSTATGHSNTSLSYGETVFGIGSTSYTPTLNGASQFRTANASDRLLVVGNAIDANNNNLVDTAERSDALVILKNGNTGIGSSTPQDKLHVAGNIRMVDGNQGTGKVLTSDANGTATWQNASANAWGLTGNTGTSSATNFLGTTDDVDLIFRRFNTRAGRIGTNNTSLGVNALNTAVTGGSNTAIGVDALKSVTTGTNNTAIGQNALGNINGGSFNTAIGAEATTSSTILTNATAIGSRAVAGSSNVLVLGSISGVNGATNSVNVGMGTTTPQTKLHIVDANKVTSNTGEGNLHVVTNDAQNTDIGGSISLGGFGSSTTTASIFGTVEGRKSNAGALSDSGYLIFKTNNVSTLTERMRITNTGNVGIGTTTPGGQFELSLDQGRKPTTNTWTVPSDARLKEVHGAYEKGLAEILQLRPIRYHYINTSKKTFDQKVLDTEACGFLAQEVQPLFPEAVGNDEDGYLNFNIHPILIASVNALKELNAKNNQLESENQALKASIQELNNKVLIIMAEIEQLKK